MSLVAFHRFLIAAAIAFCLGFAGWELRAFVVDGGSARLLLAGLFTLLALGLVVYLIRLRSILKLDQQD